MNSDYNLKETGESIFPIEIQSDETSDCVSADDISIQLDTDPLTGTLNSKIAKDSIKIIDDEAYYSRDYVEKIKTRALYPCQESITPLFNKALLLLDKAIEEITEARESLKNDDFIGQDNAMLHLAKILAELFCCRSLGDGFGAVVSALFHALANRDHGALTTETQINQIASILRKIQEEPFIQFEESIDMIMDLEDLEFNINPAHVDQMMAGFNE
ncbi:MAG: hypothetical protein WGN25_18515 [Candidatus Electrothrix sp. GW3-4]|uniref:hypothetical protein n=1 Tax=Candidatus Electrothrix sp. GW3-4 TaxID=3126740 RepID=UPI0030D5DE02